MDVKLAETAGFCFGVKKAVEKVYEQLEENNCGKNLHIYTYGPIIHNDQVVEDLKAKDTGAFLSDVVNPKFTENPTAPTLDGSLDSILNAMGLSEEKTK